MKNLRRIRQSKGMTMKELGEMCDVSESMIQMVETGSRSPSFELLLKLGEALDCSVDDLVNDKKIPATESDEYNEKHKEINALFDLCDPSDQELALDFLKRLARRQSTQDDQQESD